MNESWSYRLTSWLIKRRYFVVFLWLAIICSGLLAYQTLPLEAFPDVANMQVRVITQVAGKAPEEVERLVTIPIEKEVNGIPHSYPPRSISIFGLSVVTVVFDDKADPYRSRQQVLERIAHAELPDDVEPELDPDASPVGEIFRYTVQGKDWSSLDKKEVQDWLLNRLFKAVDGIVDSTGFGGPTKIFLVELDPGRLSALNITQSQVAQAVSRSNDSTGGSYIVSNEQRYIVRGLGLLKNVTDIGSVVVASNRDGVPIRVRDLAKVSVAEAVRKGQVGVNDDDDVVEGVLMMTRGDNPSRVIANLSRAWQDIADQLPPGMKLEPLYDRTALVKKTINTIGHNVAEGVVLVVVILMLFLFQVRSALVCSIAIPTALLGACIALKVFNIPANLLSLGAIDFGIIVDGAVIMIEHINQKLANQTELPDCIAGDTANGGGGIAHSITSGGSGIANGAAGIANSIANGGSGIAIGGCGTTNGGSHIAHEIAQATAEVAKPIIFGTTIIAMTFLPILSFEHVEGRLFKPLAVMMNLNLLAAVLFTLFVLPVICYIVFSRKPPAKRESPVVVFLERIFSKAVRVAQKRAKVILAIFLCLIVGSASLLPLVGAEFIPELEEGNIWLTVTVLPPSVTLEKSVEIAREIRSIIRTYPEAGNVLSQIGSPDDGTDPNPYSLIEVLVDLKPQETWRSKFHTKEELVTELDRAINQRLPGVVCNFSQSIKDSMEEAMSGVKNGEYAVKIFGPDLHQLEAIGDQVATILRGSPGIVDVSHDLLLGQPQLIVELEQERAARLGVTAEEVLDTVETAVGGRSISKIIDGERRFDVVLRLKKEFRESAKKVGQILVSTPGGMKVPLKQLAKIEITNGANSIVRESNKRRIAVYGNIRGRDLGSAVLDSQKRIAEKVKLPAGYSMSYAGEFERAREAGERLLVIVPITLLLIFIILYLAFDSAALALLIMSAVPVAASVAIITLFLTGTHLSVSSGVGLIALFGLTIQNAVIVLSRFKDLIVSGTPAQQAILRAVVNKMNAVVIAALVAAVGLLPATFSTGIGSQSQKPFAIVIAYGIVPSTLLTLILLPALVRLLSKKPRDASVSEPVLEHKIAK